MERTFEIRTEPHRAVIGDTVLLFEPEAEGSDFLAGYAKLRNVQTRVSKQMGGTKSSSTKHAKEADLDPEVMVDLNKSMREFVARFLLPESIEVFADMRLPERILVQLIEFAAELYGGGSGNPDDAGGTSTD